MTKADAAFSTRTPTAGQILTSNLNEPHSGPPVGASAAGASRRGVLAGLTGGAFLAAGGAATAGVSADAGLIALGDRYFEALAVSEAALARLEVCELAYDAAEPPQPDALRHKMDDHFSFDFPIGPTTRCITDDHLSAFYSADEIEALRTIPRMRGPKGRQAPCPKGQARADAVVAAWDAHQAACKALPERSALEAAGAAYDAAVKAKLAIGWQIAETLATTLDGFRVRARIIAEIYDGDLSGPAGQHTLDNQLLWATIRDLAAIS